MLVIFIFHVFNGFCCSFLSSEHLLVKKPGLKLESIAKNNFLISQPKTYVKIDG